MNWNSKTKKYTGLVNFKTKLKRSLARFLYFFNWDVKEIAKLFGMSKSRIYQYLKKQNG